MEDAAATTARAEFRRTFASQRMRRATWATRQRDVPWRSHSRRTWPHTRFFRIMPAWPTMIKCLCAPHTQAPQGMLTRPHAHGAPVSPVSLSASLARTLPPPSHARTRHPRGHRRDHPPARSRQRHVGPARRVDEIMGRLPRADAREQHHLALGALKGVHRRDLHRRRQRRPLRKKPLDELYLTVVCFELAPAHSPSACVCASQRPSRRMPPPRDAHPYTRQ